MVSSDQRQRLGLIAAIGTSQTLAWASSYYLVAIVADPIARDLSTSTIVVFAAFSMALVISALQALGSEPVVPNLSVEVLIASC